MLALIAGNTAGRGYGWSAALLTLIVFIILARRHRSVERARTRLKWWRLIKARHLARLRIEWSHLPPPSDPAPPDHPFASDLDLVGDKSVLHLLDATATEGGSARLRDWILAGDPDYAAIARRQARVRALVPQRRFRDRMGLMGLEASGTAQRRWSDRPIRAWLDGEPAGPALRRWTLALSALAIATLVLLAFDLMGGPTLWVYTFLLYAALYIPRYAEYADIFDRAYDLEHAVARARQMLLYVEHSRLDRHETLAPLWASFRGPQRPSMHYARLRRITSAATATRSDVGRIVLNVILPYNLLLALALDWLRNRLRTIAPQWFDAYYEIEALATLAAYADFHPETTAFPELLLEEQTGVLFQARALGHPLLPAPDLVRNDATLLAGQVLLLTGSNMAGKSTFLRAVGVACVFAWAGGPVDASHLRLVPLRPVTSMRVGDVLQEGLSTFYAEVRRLRLLLDAVRTPNAPPTLVLIDEMYRGTNNRERLAGARALVRALSGAPAATLVATHDLALTELAVEIPEVQNAHFREHVEEGKLLFDYRLRPGPCPTTNALVIMEQAGLPVEAPAQHDGSSFGQAAPPPSTFKSK